MTEPLSPDAIAALLLASAHAIAAEATALGPRARVRPAEGEWCANEVVGHLIEAEKRGFAGRIREILAGKEKTSAWDQVAIAKERNDCSRMGQSVWMEFMGIRNDSIKLVRSLKPGDLGKSIEHPMVGRLAVRGLLHEWVSHDRNHTRAAAPYSRAASPGRRHVPSQYGSFRPRPHPHRAARRSATTPAGVSRRRSPRIQIAPSGRKDTTVGASGATCGPSASR